MADIDVLVAAGLIPQNKIAAARAAASDAGNPSTTQTTSTQTTVMQAVAGTNASGCLDLSMNVSEGMSGSAVAALQRFLAQVGHYSGDITAYFGPVTREALEHFQKAEGIVLNGTPDTTGFGSAGPQTRATIKSISCGGASAASATGTASAEGLGTVAGPGDFFGYDLNELLDNYNADFSYEPNTSYDIDFSYNPDLGYDPDWGYELDFDFDLDFDWDSDFAYEPEFWASEEDAVKVYMEIKDSDGDFVEGSVKAIEVGSRTVTVRWDSENARNCSLEGDFLERNISIPTSGEADVYLANPSYTIASKITPSTYIAGFDTVESKYAFGLRVACDDGVLYGSSAQWSTMVHIKDGATE
jgi:peptidoglycan hydrolase-like protein with peptidoglycan-binding domain